MDWHSYYKEHLARGRNPGENLAQCQRAVMELMNNHLIPFRISAESTTGYLTALYDSAGDGFTVSFAFRIAMNALINAMQAAYESAEAKDRKWAREMMEAERADGIGPPYVPADYEVQDIDLEGEELDGVDDEPVLEELYGNGGETSSTGTRRPLPDWEHVSDWTASDWLKLQTYKDKVLAAAEAGFMGISSIAGVLAAAKDAMGSVPLSRQVELAMWAQDVVDGLMLSMEADLQKMCVILHSHDGRLVQKAMQSAASRQPKSDPD